MNCARKICCRALKNAMFCFMTPRYAKGGVQEKIFIFARSLAKLPRPPSKQCPVAPSLTVVTFRQQIGLAHYEQHRADKKLGVLITGGPREVPAFNTEFYSTLAADQPNC